MSVCTLIYNYLSFYHTDENLNQWAISFTSGLLSTLIGVIIGLPVALLIDRLLEKRKHDIAKRELLSTLFSTLIKNKSLLEQIRSELFEHKIPFYSVDIIVLESLSTQYHKQLEYSLSEKIDTCRYELTHISRKIDRLLYHFDHLITGSMKGEGFVRIKTSIIQHLDVFIPILDKLTIELNLYREDE